MVLAPALTGAFLLYQSRSGSGDLPSSSQRRHIPPWERSNFGLRFADDSIESCTGPRGRFVEIWGCPWARCIRCSNKDDALGLSTRRLNRRKTNLLMFCYRDLKGR